MKKPSPPPHNTALDHVGADRRRFLSMLLAGATGIPLIGVWDLVAQQRPNVKEFEYKNAQKFSKGEYKRKYANQFGVKSEPYKQQGPFMKYGETINGKGETINRKIAPHKQQGVYMKYAGKYAPYKQQGVYMKFAPYYKGQSAAKQRGLKSANLEIKYSKYRAPEAGAGRSARPGNVSLNFSKRANSPQRNVSGRASKGCNAFDSYAAPCRPAAAVKK